MLRTGQLRRAPPRPRDLARRRGPRNRGPWRLPGPDSHRLLPGSLALGYTSLLLSSLRRPSYWTHTPPESGVVLNTRPVKAAGCRSRATPAWPLGVTSTSRVDRRDDGSPPERRSRQGGAYAAKTVIITRCPPPAGLPRSWPGSGWRPRRWARSGGSTTGHDRGGGRPAG